MYANKSVRAHCPSRRGVLEDARAVRTMSGMAMMLGNLVHPLDMGEMPCGNLVAIRGVDSFLLKEGTLMSSSDAAPLVELNLGKLVRPMHCRGVGRARDRRQRCSSPRSLPSIVAQRICW